MKNNSSIIKICQVISIDDENDGERIKVKMVPEDNGKSINKIPFAFPLLPKMLHIKPKVGEAVLIILTNTGEGHSNRYYIGPIISQPQHMEKESFGINSLSLYPGTKKEPDIAPSTVSDSHGSFAKNSDIALYGRKKNDIIITDDDIRIRSGVRLKDDFSKCNISFNRTDPAFIHLKHNDTKQGNKGDEYRSTATIVADKINLIGNNSIYPFKTNDIEELITDEEMQKIINKAHQLPYGDILVEFLELFINAFIVHTHPYPGMVPVPETFYKELCNYNLNQILSKSVRIN